MPLSSSEELLLCQEYKNLAEYLIKENEQAWYDAEKEIVSFCVANDIYLPNIASLKISKTIELLSELLNLFKGKEKIESLKEWKEKFNIELMRNKNQIIEMHYNAHLSVGDQFLKTQIVLPKTLLTHIDMITLFSDPTFLTKEIYLFEPFSLTELSIEQEESLIKAIKENENLFIPANHQGHWFYLFKQKDSWLVKDSQPLLEGEQFSPRQESIMDNCTQLINKLTDSKPSITFETTGEQDNDYDCGTRVTNAYRILAHQQYKKQSHLEILIELVQKQVLDKEKLPQKIEDIFNQKSSMGVEQIEEIKQMNHPVELNSKNPIVSHQFSQENFLKLLDPIKEKQESRLKNYRKANKAVNKLIERIEQAAHTFYNAEFNEQSIEIFKTQCTKAIEKADGILGKHRDIFGNFFSGIKNFFIVLAKTLSRSHTSAHRLKFFDCRTDSSKILQDLKDNIEHEPYRKILENTW